jgi:hypothetical protein
MHPRVHRKLLMGSPAVSASSKYRRLKPTPPAQPTEMIPRQYADYARYLLDNVSLVFAIVVNTGVVGEWARFYRRFESPQLETYRMICMMFSESKDRRHCAADPCPPRQAGSNYLSTRKKLRNLRKRWESRPHFQPDWVEIRPLAPAARGAASKARGHKRCSLVFLLSAFSAAHRLPANNTAPAPARGA